uniref:Ig-like domain-containing protein n=1 Tax=Amphilophus citrinellus TaxID=61819 RepID=A0A3Q0RC84_AMPCI
GRLQPPHDLEEDKNGHSILDFRNSDWKNITAAFGQNVTLPCRAPNSNIPVIAVEWSRADLESEYVLLYRDEQFDPEHQHPSFKNRVDLQDRQMKDGDVSLILKDVTINDTGTYECHIIQRGTNRRKRAVYDTEPIKIISLTVDPPVPAVLIAAVFVLIYRKHKQIQRLCPSSHVNRTGIQILRFLQCKSQKKLCTVYIYNKIE